MKSVLLSGLVVVLLAVIAVLLVERRISSVGSSQVKMIESPTERVTTVGKKSRKISHVVDESTFGDKLQEIGILLSTEETLKEYETENAAMSNSLVVEYGTSINLKEKTVKGVQREIVSNDSRGDAKPWKDWFNVGQELAITDDSFPKDWIRELHNWQCPCELRRAFPSQITGFDSDNKPIWILEFGTLDMGLLLRLSTNETYFEIAEKCVQQHLYTAILSEGIKSTHDQPIRKFNYIVNFDGFRASELGRDVRKVVDFVLNMVHTHRSILLRHLHKVFIINVNPFADIMIRVLRHSFRRLSTKTELYGESRSDWGSPILKYFPKDQLPISYGGTLKTPFYQHWIHGCEILHQN